MLSTTTVALNAVAATTLYTVPFGKRCILDHATLVVGADAGSSTVSIGSSGAGVTDFVGVSNLGNIDAQYDAAILQPIPAATPVLSKSYAASTNIVMDVTGGGGGASNTVYLFGTLY